MDSFGSFRRSFFGHHGMVAWSKLSAPAPPPKRELLPAFGITLLFASAVVVVRLKGMWEDPTLLGLVAGATILLILLAALRPWTASLAAVALVLLAWKAALAIDPSHLPERFHNVSPHTISDLSSSLSLLVLRIVLLAVPVGVTLVLCLVLPAARKRFRELFRFGNWNAGIRWPLPWWGVPPMPIWLFFLIGVPLAVPSFIPMIDWQDTQDRWSHLPLSVWLMIPLLALVNAFLEEFIFRPGLLSLFGAILSAEASAIPAAVIFGFVHFHGGFPSGLAGALLLSVGGFLLGYFVIAQRGISGALAWHAVMDMVILAFVLR